MSLKKSLVPGLCSSRLRNLESGPHSSFWNSHNSNCSLLICCLIWDCEFPRATESGKEFSKRSKTYFSGELKAFIQYYLVELHNKPRFTEGGGSHDQDTGKSVVCLRPYSPTQISIFLYKFSFLSSDYGQLNFSYQ